MLIWFSKNTFRGVVIKNVLHSLLPPKKFNFGEKKLKMENAKVRLKTSPNEILVLT